MDRETIVKQINDFLIEELEIEPDLIREDARLKEDLHIDSLDFIDIAVIVERQFKVKIQPTEMKDVKLLSQFYDYVYNKLK